MNVKVLFLATMLCAAASASTASAQIPVATHLAIVKAEDARDYNSTIESHLRSADAVVQARAALAAGRIGSEDAIPALSALLAGSASAEVQAMAAFALGEIESIKGADAILSVLNAARTPDLVRARAVEAAGKIAAANAADPRAKDLGAAIMAVLRESRGDKMTILVSLTAAFRARPERAEEDVAKYLTHSDARVRADALTAMARMRAKNTNTTIRSLLSSDADPIVRANAARALGAAEDKDSGRVLIDGAIKDRDQRVRVSAVRSLAAIRPDGAGPALLSQAGQLLDAFEHSRYDEPSEKSELLELATAIGRLYQGTEDETAVRILNRLRTGDNFRSPETEVAMARVAPRTYLDAKLPMQLALRDNWTASALSAGLSEFAASKDEAQKIRAREKLMEIVNAMPSVKRPHQAKMTLAMPDVMRALVAFKPENTGEILRKMLTHEDVYVRAAAASMIADQPNTPENYQALLNAAAIAATRDTRENDAYFAALDALYKLDKKGAVGLLTAALTSPDYLVRKRALTMLRGIDPKEMPNVPVFIEAALRDRADRVLPYTAASGTRQGQVLNADADYRRALSRKNGNVSAVFTTRKGKFTVDLLPEDAPLTVDNFVKLARSSYFNGLAVHRVVANFVMQDGDPLGNGSGGPGWSIRCEINTLMYGRGAVGMALSGKDTGGSQWFVTHSPQPHLDGGYTIFGQVNDAGMKVVDNIVRGDRIVSVRIVEKVAAPIRRVKR